MLWAELCPSKNSYVGVLTLRTSECDHIWRRRLFRGDYVKMRALGRALIQHDWCPYKKRRLRHRQAQRGDHVRTQGEDGCLQAKERGLRRNQPCQHLDLRLPAPKTENRLLLFQPPGLWCFITAAQQTNTPPLTPQKFSRAPVWSLPAPNVPAQPLTYFLSPSISLHFLELHIMKFSNNTLFF